MTRHSIFLFAFLVAGGMGRVRRFKVDTITQKDSQTIETKAEQNWFSTKKSQWFSSFLPNKRSRMKAAACSSAKEKLPLGSRSWGN